MITRIFYNQVAFPPPAIIFQFLRRLFLAPNNFQNLRKTSLTVLFGYGPLLTVLTNCPDYFWSWNFEDYMAHSFQFKNIQLLCAV